MLTVNQACLFGSEPATPSAKESARSGTFVDNLKLPVHRWFRYSAGFSAQWAESVIKEHRAKVVLDPFAGSGTTLLAAESAGALAFGYESHPFVARIAAAKLEWDHSPDAFLIPAQDLLDRARRRSQQSLGDVPVLIEKCYSKDVLQELYMLRDQFAELEAVLAPEVAKLIWLSITSILRLTSFVGTAQWQYVLPNKRKAKLVSPFVAFEGKIAEMAADMTVMRATRARSDARIFGHDARSASTPIAPGSVDLVVTSPPYPNNYDYADATRLEMTFWGEISGWSGLQQAVRQYIVRSCSQHSAAEKLKLETLLDDPAVAAIRPEIQPVCNELAIIRETKGGKKTYHTMVAAYFCDLSRVLASLRTVCTDGSTICFVVGDSAPYGVYVPAERWIGELAIAAGFRSYKFEKLRDRNVKWKNRKHRVPLHEGRLWIEG